MNNILTLLVIVLYGAVVAKSITHYYKGYGRSDYYHTVEKLLKIKRQSKSMFKFVTNFSIFMCIAFALCIYDILFTLTFYNPMAFVVILIDVVFTIITIKNDIEVYNDVYLYDGVNVQYKDNITVFLNNAVSGCLAISVVVLYVLQFIK